MALLCAGCPQLAVGDKEKLERPVQNGWQKMDQAIKSIGNDLEDEMECLEFIKTVADDNLDYILANGHARPGCNGPYHNRDTPVRNSAHWLITYKYLYETTRDQTYYEAVRRLADYLLDEEHYGTGGSVRCRTDVRFDHTNGLIGQAWVMEGLISAACFFNGEIYYERAADIFRAQAFHPVRHLWEIRDWDGTKDFDLTFNHQLWFAAAGAMILEYEREHNLEPSADIDRQIRLFLDAALSRYFRVHEDGLIVHVVDCQMTAEEKKYIRDLNEKRKRRSIRQDLSGVIRKKLHDKAERFSFTEGLEKGYHIFDLYGFALLKQQYGWHGIFRSENFRRAVEYGLNTDALMELRNSCGGKSFNKFAFSYNSPAFEYPFVSRVFSGSVDQELEEELLSFQLEQTFDGRAFSRNGTDGETMGARLYELVRYLCMEPGYEVELRKKRKVCFVTNNIAEIGGRQRVNTVLANEMAESADMEVAVLFTDSWESAQKPAYELSSKVRVLWSREICRGNRDLPYKGIRYINKKIWRINNLKTLQFAYFPPAEVAAYNRFFHENKFDILIGVGTRPGGMLALVEDKSRKIAWLHNSYDTYFRRKNYFQWNQEELYKKLLSRLDTMVVLTDGERTRYQEEMKAPAVRIYNPLTCFCADKSGLDGKRLIFVGRLKYDLKGLDLLVQILAAVRAKIPDILLTVVGDGDGRERFEREIEQAGLKGNVKMVGNTRDVMQYYTSASAAVLSSRQEGFGLVVTEAMECGLPVISFKTEGPSEIIQDGVNGFLVDNYDVSSFAEKIITLWEKPELRKKMGENAARRAEDFSCKSILGQWKTLFDRLMRCEDDREG